MDDGFSRRSAEQVVRLMDGLESKPAIGQLLALQRQAAGGRSHTPGGRVAMWRMTAPGLVVALSAALAMSGLTRNAPAEEA